MNEEMNRKIASIGRQLEEAKQRDTKDCDGPCREGAHSIIRRRVAELRRRADGMEALANAVPEGVAHPAEESLWDLLMTVNPSGRW